MTRTGRIPALQILLSVCIFSLIACASAGRRSAHAPLAGRDTTTLRVAIYPYVPRPDQFKTAIAAAWKAKQPGVPLEFVEWDCYSSDPPQDLDVFVFDAIFLDYFQSQGFLAPISEGEIHESADFLRYALEGSRIDGALYGIPQLGCANILFYRQGDHALETARNLREITQAIGECTYSGLTPPPGTGLMVDLSGGTTDSCLYIEAVEDIYGSYTPEPPLPPEASKVDAWAIHNLWSLLRMASVEQARYSGDNPYQRAAWFGEGLGRATIGFTESMSAMGEEGRSKVAFRLMPLSDRTDVSLFYVDLIGINASTVSNNKRALALDLANLMASTEVMVRSIGPTAGYDDPQYLMPVRHSVFHHMEQTAPLYGNMYKLVKMSTPRLFRLGPGSRPWLNEMKNQLRNQVFMAPSCQGSPN